MAGETGGEKNIVLCGFMGCGKSFLGQALAAALDRPFVDSDEQIESLAGRSIPEIFAAEGEAGFRALEHQALCAIGVRRGQVLSTGGGALTFPRNLPPLREGGVIFYLNPGFETCYQRIWDSDRPLVQSNSRAQLEALYRARDPLYRAAAHHELALGAAPLECWLAAVLERI